MKLISAASDEYPSYTGEKLVPQKSGYMLATTAALRLEPGSNPQPLHRVSYLTSQLRVCFLSNARPAGPDGFYEDQAFKIMSPDTSSSADSRKPPNSISAAAPNTYAPLPISPGSRIIQLLDIEAASDDHDHKDICGQLWEVNSEYSGSAKICSFIIRLGHFRNASGYYHVWIRIR